MGSPINGSPNEHMGASIALNYSGNIVAVGCSAYSSSRGRIQVYEYSGGSWSQLGSDIVGDNTLDLLGLVGLDLNEAGDRLVCGASAILNRNYVRVYEYAGSSWSKVGADITGGAAANFGSESSLSLNASGDIVSVGSYGDDNGGTDAGRLNIYQYTGGSNWSDLGQPIDGDSAGDGWGISASLNGDGTRVVGGAHPALYAKSYEYDGGTWSQIGSTVTGTGGMSLDLNSAGDLFVMGAPGYDEPTADIGRAQVFQYLNSEWGEVSTGVVGEAGTAGLFANDVAIAKTGTNFAVGSSYYPAFGAGGAQGRVYTYSISGLPGSAVCFPASGPISFSGLNSGSAYSYITTAGGSVTTAGGISLSHLFSSANSAGITLSGSASYSAPHRMSEFYGMCQGAGASCCIELEDGSCLFLEDGTDLDLEVCP